MDAVALTDIDVAAILEKTAPKRDPAFADVRRPVLIKFDVLIDHIPARVKVTTRWQVWAA